MKKLLKLFCFFLFCVNVHNGYSQIDAYVDVQTPVSCAGGLDGSVIIGFSGGQAPFQFSLDAGAPQAENWFILGGGAHSVLVTDADGNQDQVSFTIAEPTPLSFNTSITDASCNGSCDGNIAITAQNAMPPYLYSHDNGLTYQPSNVLTGLCAGNINVVVKDDNGCLANSVEVVFEPAILNLSPLITDVSCPGSNDGQIGFSVTGGTPSYSFSVDNGTSFNTNNPQNGIAAGVYSIVVKDDNGCKQYDQVIVSSPPPLTFSQVGINPSTCGSPTGYFDYIVSGGTAPYSYSIDGGSTTQTSNGFFGGLFSGLYTLTVYDVTGCESSILVPLPDNVMTTNLDAAVPATCKSACDGVAIVSQQFGSPPFTYSLNTGGTQASGVFANLCAGQHFVTIADNGLCLGIQEVNITEPDTITFNPSIIDIVCPDAATGTIDFGTTAGGDGGAYTYSIMNGSNAQSSSVFTGLAPGDYDLVAMDANGCVGVTTVRLEAPLPWDITTNAVNLKCFEDNSGFIQIIGGGANPPYTFDLSGNILGPNPAALYAGLAAGNYSISITDALGCTTATLKQLIEPDKLITTYSIIDESCSSDLPDGEINIFANGGNAPYIYSSDGGVIRQSSNQFTGLAAGMFEIYVRDRNGCLLQDSVLVNMQDGTDCIGLSISNTFSPNNDGVNDFFEIEGIEDFPSNSLTIFNRWGDIIYESFDMTTETNTWDGKNWDGRHVSTGTYFYVVTYGGNQTLNGWVQVVR